MAYSEFEKSIQQPEGKTELPTNIPEEKPLLSNMDDTWLPKPLTNEVPPLNAVDVVPGDLQPGQLSNTEPTWFQNGGRGSLN